MTNVIFKHGERLNFVYHFNQDIWEQLQYWFLF